MIQNQATETVIILVVDDNPADRRLIERALQSAGLPCELRVAHDGQDALDYLRLQGHYRSIDQAPRPHLILLDLNMPGLNGLRLLQHLKQDIDDPLSTIPVVVLSTSSHPQDLQDSYSFGCASFVQKPFEVKDFMDVVGALAKYWIQIARLPTLST